MGASWLEIETLLQRFEAVEAFPHAEALAAVPRARVALAEAAVIVSVAGLSDDPRSEADTVAVLARARHLIAEAEVAVQRARDAVTESRTTAEEARRRIVEARLLRARDHAGPFLTHVGLAEQPPVVESGPLGLPTS